MRKLLSCLRRPLRHEEYTSKYGGAFYDLVKVLHKGKTAFQKISIVETKEAGRALLLDNILQFTEAGEYQYHEPMAHIPMLAHPNPKKVLVIGGGDGALVREVLRHKTVERLDFVELDKGVIDFCRRYVPELGAAAFDDARVLLHIEDGRAFVARAAEEGKTWDVILMDMTDPIGPSLPLYTREYFGLVRKVLADVESLFIMHSESPDCRPRLFAKIQATLKAAFPQVTTAISHIRMYGGLWSWAICTTGKNPSELSAEEVATRIEERKLENLRIVSPKTWPSFFTLWPLVDSLSKEPLPPATDSNPDYPA